MSSSLSLETRVARLEARAEIAELVSAYGVACDEHDIARLKTLFTPDASFESPNGRMQAKGRDAIIAMFVKVLGNRGPGYHWTHDHFVRFDQGREGAASGLVYSHAETTPNGVMSLAAMKYDDTYAQENGVWKFARRQISFLYYVPATEYATSLSSTDRVTMDGTRVAADYPEKLDAWQQFAAAHAAAEK
jgi:uncharacterized protein (TIGR02246 family)